MKIGIMTFWWSQDNYGQLLQCYALQKYLRDMGHDAYLIRYNFSADNDNSVVRKLLKGLNPFLLIKFICRKIKKVKIAVENNKHDRRFNEFRIKNLRFSENSYLKFNDLKNNPPHADMYIAGSDQVWHFQGVLNKSIKKMIHTYMLDFGSESILRVSYAASWSLDEVSKTVQSEVIPLLSKFKYVGVRERNGIDLCKLCSCDIAELVPDPTLLIAPDDYRKLYRVSENRFKNQKQPFIFLYLLENQCELDKESVFNYAKSRGLKVFYTTGNGLLDKYTKCYPTIEEWLYLIDNAEFVITNSFHCAVFSCLFNKSFGVSKLVGKFEGMNSRFDTLFESFQIEPRYIINNDLSNIEHDKNCYELKNINISNFVDLLKIKEY